VAERQPKRPRKRPSKTTPGARPPEPPDTGYGDGYPGEERGEAVEAHAEFVERHFGGGVEATPELFDRAIEVWQRLPGAVARGPAQIRPNRPAAPSGGGEYTAS
jgi:hypothetical protein